MFPLFGGALAVCVVNSSTEDLETSLNRRGVPASRRMGPALQEMPGLLTERSAEVTETSPADRLGLGVPGDSRCQRCVRPRQAAAFPAGWGGKACPVTTRGQQPSLPRREGSAVADQSIGGSKAGIGFPASMLRFTLPSQASMCDSRPCTTIFPVLKTRM